MAQYLFLNKDTGETREITQKMCEDHVYFDEHGKQWERIYTVPKVSISTKIDPFSEKSFLEKTKEYKTLGDLWDISKEMSEKRTQKQGRDEMKQKTFKKYSKERKGKKLREEVLSSKGLTESDVKSFKKE